MPSATGLTPNASETKPGALILGASVGAVALITALDYVTGWEISFSIFYLGPVAFAAWRGGRDAGIALAVVAGLAWSVADVLSHAYAHALIPYWNAAVRLAVFTIVAVSLARIKGLQRQLVAAARTDGLTGLANTRSFGEAAQRELARMRRTGRPLTIAYIDVDDFKELNDRRGHLGGDAFLQAVARTLVANLREIDMAVRVGGDEMALLLPETGVDDALSCLGRINVALSLLAEEEDGCTCSIGAVTFEGPPSGFEEMLRRADELMYEVKRSGKGQVRHDVVHVQAPGEAEIVGEAVGGV